jgi:hypothetical protein
LLVFSYLVVPAVIAQMWFESVRQRLLLGWLVAILASTAGILWSFYQDYPTGPAVVVMLGIFLIASSIVYYVNQAALRMRALVHVLAILAFFAVFFSGLSLFRNSEHELVSGHADPVDLLIQDMNSGEETRQLHVFEHLDNLKDPRILKAFESLLQNTKSEQVVEIAVDFLIKHRDSRAAPILKHLATAGFDAPLRVAIAKAQLAAGDLEGYRTLLGVLRADGEDFARKQANDLLVSSAGKNFGYRPEVSVSDNAAALKQIENWLTPEIPKIP